MYGRDGTEKAVLSPETVHDVELVSAVYSRGYLELRNYAWSLVNSKDDAEDVVSQAFANTLSAIKEGAVVDSPLPWLYRCVRNLAMDRHREETYAPLEDALDVSTHEDPEKITELTERCSAIKRSIDRLPKHLRQVFLLAELRGLSYQEIAKIMERSVASVRHLLFRARSEVRKSADPDDVVLIAPLFGAGYWIAHRSDHRLRAALSVKLDQMQAWLSGWTTHAAELLSRPIVASTLIVAGLASVGIGIGGLGKDVSDAANKLGEAAPGRTTLVSSPSSHTRNNPSVASQTLPTKNATGDRRPPDNSKTSTVEQPSAPAAPSSEHNQDTSRAAAAEQVDGDASDRNDTPSGLADPDQDLATQTVTSGGGGEQNTPPPYIPSNSNSQTMRSDGDSDPNPPGIRSYGDNLSPTHATPPNQGSISRSGASTGRQPATGNPVETNPQSQPGNL